MKPNRYFIGITGSIATGKSQASSYLSSCGYSVIDADRISREVVTSQEVMQQLETTMGEKLYVDGILQREKLANLIFHHPHKREQLNEIVHPLIYGKILDEANRLPDRILFFDIPLLIETRQVAQQEGLQLDELWMIYVPKEVQIQRLMMRDKIDGKYAQAKVDSQMDVEEKKKYCDVIIDNSQTVEVLYQQLNRQLERIKKKMG